MSLNENYWQFSSDDQQKKMNEDVTTENCGDKLMLIRDIAGSSRMDLAKCIGCRESTITRLELKKSLPTDRFMLRIAALSAIGHVNYLKMSEAEKEKVSDVIGASGGIIAGVGGALGAISVSGTVAGFSAAGITSGLSAIGGTMIGGLAVVASIPVGAGLAGYGLVKGVKAIFRAKDLTSEEVDERFEKLIN